MARPFQEASYPAMSSLASQTTLGYDETGQSCASKSGKKEKKRPRIPKIKSLGDDLATARGNHARSNKKGNPTSATPTSPTFLPDYLLQSSGSSLPSVHVNPYSQNEKSSKSKAKIKPLLRKFSSQEQVGIDLSRSAAENEGLAIYEQSAAPTRTTSNPTRHGIHNRTISGTSQMSNATTSSNRYVHPMRQIPRPYTPPVSYKDSLESDPSEDAVPYAPLPSARRGMPPLHIRTGSSFTNSSQTNLPGTPSSLRFPTDPDMMPPTTQRSSFESAFRKTRSRSNTVQTDPAQQAASVQALRQRFQAKEAAKDRKYAEAERKAAEKEQRKVERKQARSRAASEKSSLAGIAYGQQPQQGLQSKEQFPTLNSPATQGVAPPPTLRNKEQRSRGGTNESAGKKVQSQWTLFWMKIRTMWLKIRRKMAGKMGES